MLLPAKGLTAKGLNAKAVSKSVLPSPFARYGQYQDEQLNTGHTLGSPVQLLWTPFWSRADIPPLLCKCPWHSSRVASFGSDYWPSLVDCWSAGFTSRLLLDISEPA